MKATVDYVSNLGLSGITVSDTKDYSVYKNQVENFDSYKNGCRIIFYNIRNSGMCYAITNLAIDNISSSSFIYATNIGAQTQVTVENNKLFSIFKTFQDINDEIVDIHVFTLPLIDATLQNPLATSNVLDLKAGDCFLFLAPYATSYSIIRALVDYPDLMDMSNFEFVPFGSPDTLFNTYNEYRQSATIFTGKSNFTYSGNYNSCSIKASNLCATNSRYIVISENGVYEDSQYSPYSKDKFDGYTKLVVSDINGNVISTFCGFLDYDNTANEISISAGGFNNMLVSIPDGTYISDGIIISFINVPLLRKGINYCSGNIFSYYMQGIMFILKVKEGVHSVAFDTDEDVIRFCDFINDYSVLVNEQYIPIICPDCIKEKVLCSCCCKNNYDNSLKGNCLSLSFKDKISNYLKYCLIAVSFNFSHSIVETKLKDIISLICNSRNKSSC